MKKIFKTQLISILIKIINLLIVLTAINKPKNKNINNSKKSPDTFVYLTFYEKHFFLGILSILSLNYFIPNLRYILINGGEIKNTYKKIVNKININIKIIDKLPKTVSDKITDKKHIKMMIDYGWIGKKFFIPTLLHPKSNIILMDSDTLFLNKPKEIIKWIKNPNCNLYLKDYMNFMLLSKIETKSIINKKPHVQNLNSGLLLLNLDNFWKNNSLEKIDSYISSTVKIVKSRMIRDFHSSQEIYYIMHILEQTLYSLSLNNATAKPLNSKYSLLNSKENANNKCSFMHFTPDDASKLLYYKYLTMSIIFSLKKKNLNKPWFIRAKFSAFQKKYLNKKVFRSNSTKLFDEIEIQLTQ